jgi:hypothetical protein
MLPLRPGQIERRTHDYKRHGTTSLYAAFDILTGKLIGRTTKQHRAKEFLDFLVITAALLDHLNSLAVSDDKRLGWFLLLSAGFADVGGTGFHRRGKNALDILY